MGSTDPQRTWYYLKENLDYQLKARPIRSFRLDVVLGRAGDKKLQKYLSRGWQIQSTSREPFWRRVHHHLTRPEVTREEEEFLGWR